MNKNMFDNLEKKENNKDNLEVNESEKLENSDSGKEEDQKKPEKIEDIFSDSLSVEPGQEETVTSSYNNGKDKPKVFSEKSSENMKIEDESGKSFFLLFALIFSFVFLIALIALYFLYGDTIKEKYFSSEKVIEIEDIKEQPDNIIEKDENFEIQEEKATIDIPVSMDKIDSDGDGLSDEKEMELGTNINNIDTDGDGLYDREEVLVYKTNPKLKDTDGDGFSDGNEVKDGYNPKGPGKLYDINQQ